MEAASAHSSRELRGLLKSPFRRLARVGKVRSGDPGLPRLVWARVTSVQRSAFPSPAGEGPRVGVTSAEEPAPRAVAWGRRGGARRWAGRGSLEERAGRVCSCPCLALGRGRASARTGGEPAGAAVVGFDWRGGEVTCEQLRPPRPDRAGLAGPHATLRGWGRGAGRVRARSWRRGGVAPSAPPPAPGRVGAMGVGTHRAAAGWGGRSETLRAPVPAGSGGRGAGRGWRGRRRPTPCWGLWETGRSGGSPPGRRSGWNRLGPAATVRGTPPRGPGPGLRRAAGDWTSRHLRSCGGSRTRVPRSCGLKTLQGLGVRGTL